MYFQLSSQGALAFNFVRHQSHLPDRVGFSNHNSVGLGSLKTHIKLPKTTGSGGILTPLLSTGWELGQLLNFAVSISLKTNKDPNKAVVCIVEQKNELKHSEQCQHIVSTHKYDQFKTLGHCSRTEGFLKLVPWKNRSRTSPA